MACSRQLCGPDDANLPDNVFMPIQIAAGETDDPQFITLLNSLVCGLAENDKPQELWIIQIDNWFDLQVAQILRHRHRTFPVSGHHEKR
jgi:hypothetical protein